MKSGKRLQFSYSAMQTLVRITAVSEDGVLSLRGVRVPISATVEFGSLSLGGKTTLALAVLEDGKASDHENAAFFLKSTGRDSDAQVLLLRAGDAAVVVSGFPKPEGPAVE